MKPRSRLRRHFLTGLAIWLPIVVTLYLLRFFFLLADNVLGRYANLLIERFFHRPPIPGVGLLLALLLLPVTGYIGNQFFGKRFVGALERWFGALPIVRHIYPPAKEMSDLLFTQKNRVAFRRVVLVPYPSRGLYTLGFVTNEALPAMDAATGTHLVAVLVPHTPSPLTGFVVYVPAGDLVTLNISVEEGIGLIVSGGVIGPGKDNAGPASRLPRIAKS